VATISRMHKNIGLFCKRDLQKRPIFCKETYIFKHPTHRSHPIIVCMYVFACACMCGCVYVCMCVYIGGYVFGRMSLVGERVYVFVIYIYIYIYKCIYTHTHIYTLV